MIFFLAFYCYVICLAKGGIIKETDPLSAEDTKPKDFTEIFLNESEESKPLKPAALLINLNSYAVPHELTPSGHQLWEGDLILSEEQVQEIYGPSYRKAIDDSRKRWPEGIIYYRLLNSSEPDRKLIVSAIQHWMDNTCLKFYEVNANFDAAHLYFNKSKGCNSKVGMKSKTNGQQVSIGKGCRHIGKIAHEIGHAIGFYHEHSRPDRNRHIRIINKNIKPDKTWNFVIRKNSNNYGIQYDLTSIMHYDGTVFSANGKRTIVPLDPTAEFLIGKKSVLSFGDIKMANLMYKCGDHCKTKPICLNSGFVNHKCECICSPEFEGSDCGVPAKLSKDFCGGNITSPTTLTSPNYPKNYPKDTRCIWTIKAPVGKKVRLDVGSFDLHNPSKGNKCRKDFLEVRLGNKYDGKKYCKNDLERKRLFLTSSKAVLLFKADFNKNKGFSMKVKFI